MKLGGYMHFLRASTIFLSIWFIISCTVNPVTGEKQLTLMSGSQEVALGEKNYLPYQQQQGGRYQVDPELSFYVTGVGKKLAAVSDRPQLPYEFVVLNNSTPNAWALPGGKIAINRGLLVMLDDEAQLAAVLSHEIVHAAARHGALQQTQNTLIQAGVMAVGIAAAKDSENAGWILAGAGLGAGVWQAKYSRNHELESDKYGVEYMVRAGYDPQGAVELQQKFVELSKGQKKDLMSALFASHPPSQARVERNRKLAALHPGGARNKANFERATKQLSKDAKAYKLHDQAMQAASKNNLPQALSLTQQAITIQPQESLFYITKGQLSLAQKKRVQALSAFKAANALNPEYFMGHLGEGLVYRLQHKQPAAISALKKSMGILATPTASYYLGEYAEASGDLSTAKSYFEFAAQGQGKIAEAAKEKLTQLNTTTP